MSMILSMFFITRLVYALPMFKTARQFSRFWPMLFRVYVFSLRISKLQSLVVNGCKILKIYTSLQNLQILYTFVLRTENWYRYREKGINFPCVLQKYTKFANFADWYFSHFTTFCNQTLQFTNFRMLFHAVVMNFTISIFFKILSIMQ